jgi:hypothetical protein
LPNTPLAAFRASIEEAAAYANAYPDEARRTQITFLKLPEPVAMATELPVYSPAAEVRVWRDQGHAHGRRCFGEMNDVV